MNFSMHHEICDAGVTIQPWFQSEQAQNPVISCHPIRPLLSAAQRLECVWDGDSLDWKDISAGEITQRVTSKVQPGSIVLFHNAALHTPEALPSILQTLLQEGYTFVPISQLILCDPYTIDHTGRQLPAC